jgi:hypothetical protein
MLAIHEIEVFLQRTPVFLQDIVFELRNLIAEVAPDAVEVIRWGGLSYFHEGRGGIVSASICQIAILENRIGLGFIHGVCLSDPHQLLEGSQKAKRYVWINSYEDAPWEDLKQLIEESSHFDPRQLKLN